MRHLLFAAMLTASVLSVSAAHLSPEAALHRAMDFMPSAAISISSSTPQLSAPAVANAEAEKSHKLLHTFTTSTGEAACYVFSLCSDGGFIIASADDVAMPLLGFADSGEFDVRRLPDNMLWWLDNYADEISYALHACGVSSACGRVKGVSLADVRQSSFSPIAPMLSTLWDQSAPFNNDCPIEDGKRSYTGCVATAISQIMRHHSWPATGVGEKSYQWVPVTGGVQTLSFDYGDTRFDWEAMADDYAHGGSARADSAVATLIFASGVSVETRYHSLTSGSSADSYRVPEGLATYFAYDKSLTWRSRAFYHTSDWEATVYASLADGCPVYYCGENSSTGHAFVCDGYSDGYFHINWGWGGSGNGYFRLSALTPDSQGIGGSTSGYNYNQAAVTSITPDKGTEKPAPVLLCTSALSGQLVSSQIRFNGPFTSYSSGTIFVRFGARFYNTATGDNTYSPSYTYRDLQSRYQFANFSSSVPSTLPDGVYHVYPVFANTQNPQSADEWHDIPTMVATPSYLELKIDGGERTLSVPPVTHVDVSDIKLLTPLYLGYRFQVEARISNPSSDGELYEPIRALIVDSQYNTVGQGDIFVTDLRQSQSKTVVYESSLQVIQGFTTGRYRMIFVNANDNTILSEPVEVEVSQFDQQTVIEVDWHLDGDLDSLNAYAITTTANISCLSGYFAGNLTLFIFPRNGGTSLTYISSPTVFVNEGEQTDLTFTGTFSEATLDTEYFAMLYYGSQTVNDHREYFTITTKAGIDGVTTDATPPTLTGIWTIDGRRVNATSTDALPPGLYLLRHTSADGRVTVSKTLKR